MNNILYSNKLHTNKNNKIKQGAFDYNDVFNLYSFKLDNEVAAKLICEFNNNSSSSQFNLKLLSKNNNILSTLSLNGLTDCYIERMEYNNSSSSLIIYYENHSPIICDLKPLVEPLVNDINKKQDIIDETNPLDYNFLSNVPTIPLINISSDESSEGDFILNINYSNNKNRN